MTATAGWSTPSRIRLTGDATLSEECVQDVFVTLWRRAADFDPTRAKLTTWLFVVARNRAIELGRQKNAKTRAAGRSRARRVRRPMRQISSRWPTSRNGWQRRWPNCRRSNSRCFGSSYFDGLSHAEIAEVIGIPLGTVKGRVRLALERLRSLSETYDLQTGLMSDDNDFTTETRARGSSSPPGWIAAARDPACRSLRSDPRGGSAARRPSIPLRPEAASTLRRTRSARRSRGGRRRH